MGHSNSENERIAQFAADVLTLWHLWEKSITVTVSGYTFTVSSAATVRIQKRSALDSGSIGMTDLGELRSFPSGMTEVQWFITAPST